MAADKPASSQPWMDSLLREQAAQELRANSIFQLSMSCSESSAATRCGWRCRSYSSSADMEKKNRDGDLWSGSMSTQLGFGATAASAEQPRWGEKKCIFWALASIKSRRREHWSAVDLCRQMSQPKGHRLDLQQSCSKMGQSSLRRTFNDSVWRNKSVN